MKENQSILQETKIREKVLIDKIQKISHMFDTTKFSKSNYCPSMEDIILMKSNIPKYSIFIMWILSNTKNFKSDEETKIMNELEVLMTKYMKPKQLIIDMGEKYEN